MSKLLESTDEQKHMSAIRREIEKTNQLLTELVSLLKKPKPEAKSKTVRSRAKRTIIKTKKKDGVKGVV